MSRSKLEKFAAMANQIGDNYAALPAQEGAAGVALHIEKFWTPKMILETITALDAGIIEMKATSAQGFAILKQHLTSAR